MDYIPIEKLAEQGFLFSPTSMGMTRSDRTEWQNIATNFSHGNANTGRPANILVSISEFSSPEGRTWVTS